MNNIYMLEAIKEAKKAFKEDEVPIGCVIVLDGKIIARAHNIKEKKKDPTAHAEVECIKKACKKLNSKYLDECEMYVTLEPCIMCAGAIKEARLKAVYFSVKDDKTGAIVSRETLSPYQKKIKYGIGLCSKESKELLREFFKNKRK